MMRNITKTDIFLIALGLATLVVQRFLLPPDFSGAEEKEGSTRVLAVGPAQGQVIYTPEWELTYPEGSKYQDLTPPAGVTPNPFLEVRRIAEVNGRLRDYAGKDTDMRQLLLAHAGKDYLFVLQQQAANEMLRRELFQHFYSDPTHSHMLEAIGFYTEQLVEAKSEDAKLIYMCLQALKHHWSKERIAKVALTTASRVQARTLQSAKDTATTHGYHRQVYARELKKLGSRLQNNA